MRNLKITSDIINQKLIFPSTVYFLKIGLEIIFWIIEFIIFSNVHCSRTNFFFFSISLHPYIYILFSFSGIKLVFLPIKLIFINWISTCMPGRGKCRGEHRQTVKVFSSQQREERPVSEKQVFRKIGSVLNIMTSEHVTTWLSGTHADFMTMFGICVLIHIQLYFSNLSPRPIL